MHFVCDMHEYYSGLTSWLKQISIDVFFVNKKQRESNEYHLLNKYVANLNFHSSL